jgi:hypothetical protein
MHIKLAHNNFTGTTWNPNVVQFHQTPKKLLRGLFVLLNIWHVSKVLPETTLLTRHIFKIIEPTVVKVVLDEIW